jgi:hypothetical protein
MKIDSLHFSVWRPDGLGSCVAGLIRKLRRDGSRYRCGQSENRAGGCGSFWLPNGDHVRATFRLRSPKWHPSRSPVAHSDLGEAWHCQEMIVKSPIFA